MIRHLHPTDVPALLPFKQRSGPDEVVAIGNVFGSSNRSFPLVKYTSVALSPRAWLSCWVKTRRAGIQAVLRAGPRSGPHAWELSELFVSKNGREVAAEVLDQLAFQAGASGARRVFLRLSTESDLFDLARSAGYTPVFSEDLFSAESAQSVLGSIGETSGEHELRQLEDTDKHSLFRLYCSTTPIDVRSKTGQTLDEWESGSEKPGRKAATWVVESDPSNGLEAQVTSSDISGGRFFSLSCDANSACSVESLIAAGVGEAGEKKVFTLVPSYNQNLSETLQNLGFTKMSTYDVMVKTLAVRASEKVPGLVVAE